MNAKKYLQFLKDEIHSTVFATVDEQGLPQTCVIDIMLCDDDSLYFLTAKGKKFYDRLVQRQYVAISGMRGKDTMSTDSISLRGKVREVGAALLPRVFAENPYMAEIYPDEESRSVLTVFQLYEGEGEFFRIAGKEIVRDSFSFGGAPQTQTGYVVTDKCIGCKLCYSVCPRKCIDMSATPVVIDQHRCIHCGKCAEVCPAGAIEKR